MRVELADIDLLALGFTRDTSRGHPIWRIDLPEPLPGCSTALHLLPAKIGYLAELWNAQHDEEPKTAQRAAFPLPLTHLEQLLALLRVCGVEPDLPRS
jgi:hypothetical protein